MAEYVGLIIPSFLVGFMLPLFPIVLIKAVRFCIDLMLK